MEAKPNGLIETLLEEMVNRVGSQITDQVREAIRAEMASRGPAGAPGEVNGIDPNKLYTVAFLAERWAIEREQTVRDIDQALLPRAPWHGSGIRYRGADILRYEGVSLPEAPVTPIETRSRANTPGRRSRLPEL